MVHVITEYGKEEESLIAEIMVDSPSNKRKRMFTRVIAVFGMLVSFITIYNAINQGEFGFGAILFTLVGILFALYAIFARKYQILRLKKYYEKGDKNTDKALLKREYFISGDEIRILGKGMESKVQWNAIERCYEKDNYYILMIVGGSLILLNQNKMNEEEKNEIRQILIEKGKINL